jgi:hypothetical protein
LEALYIFGSNKVCGAIQNQISEKTDRKKEEKMHNTMVNETERDEESQAERRGVDKHHHRNTHKRQQQNCRCFWRWRWRKLWSGLIRKAPV